MSYWKYHETGMRIPEGNVDHESCEGVTEDDRIQQCDYWNQQGRRDHFIRVIADVGTGEGDLVISGDFLELDSLLQADLLKDWIGLFQRCYDEVTGPDFLKDLGRTEINESPPTDAVN